MLAPSQTVDVQAVGSVPKPERPERVITTPLVAGYDQRVTLWGAVLTRDGIPSRLAGPLIALTGPQPLVVPQMTVSADAATGTDSATWAVPKVPAEIALERSTDGGTSWARVSPWMPPATIGFELPGSSAHVYRLVLRGRGQTVPGPAVPAA